MMKSYEPVIPNANGITLNFYADLGNKNALEGTIANLGSDEFKIKMWLGLESTIPFTLPPGTRIVFPCQLSKIDIIPVNGAVAFYQAVLNG